MATKLVFLGETAVLLISPLAWPQASNVLSIYFVDVEGGQSTLFVSPLKQSLLADTGFPGERDAARIAAAAKDAGVSKIDYLLITHYHGDHVGATELPSLCKPARSRRAPAYPCQTRPEVKLSRRPLN